MSVPPAPPLLLASTSPQRRAILHQLGIPFDVVAPSYVEHDPPDADPAQLVREHALGKARSVAADADDRPVLGVDTTVALDGRIYAKPADAGDAERMLEELSGRTVTIADRQVVSFSSCSYLGLERHPRLIAGVHAATRGEILDP